MAQFPLGNQANNMEIGITGCEVAATVYTRQAFYKEWAETRNILGSAYSQRIRGDKAENLEAAIRFYSEALEVFSREAFPGEWAMLLPQLGDYLSSPHPRRTSRELGESN
jgi:hypothetical protein